MAVVVCSSLTVEYKKMLMRRISSLLVCSVHARVHVRVCMRIYMQTDVYANLLLLLCHTSTMERDMALRASSCMLVLHVRTCVHMRKRFLCECAGTGTDIDIHETVFHVCALSLCVCAIIMMMR